MTDELGLYYGVRPVLEVLRSGSHSVEKLYLLKGRGDRLAGEVLQLARAQGIPFHFESKTALNRIASTDKHQGIVALTAAKGYATFEDLLDSFSKTSKPPLLLLLDGVEDPRNLGAILRSVEAVGAHGVLLPKHRSVGLTPVVAKVSAGALEHVPVARVNNLSRAIEVLKREGFRVIALEPSASCSYTTADYTDSIAIVVGGEGKGVRQGILKHCDEQVCIPMEGKVQSLNVSVAVGVLLYEVLRQRRLTTKGS